MSDRPPPPGRDGPRVADHRPPPPVGPDPRGVREPIGWKRAPVLFGLALVNAPVAGWFAIWGIDNVNHCNDLPAGQTCGLGFAVGVPLGWVATALLACAVLGLSFVRSPKWVLWLGCALAVAAMWAVNVGALSLYQARAI